MAVCGHPELYDSSYWSKLYSGNKHFKLCLLVIWLTDLTQHEFRLFTRWHYEVLISASSWSFNCIQITEKSLCFGFILMWFSVIFIFAMLISRTITKKGYRFEPLSQTIYFHCHGPDNVKRETNVLFLFQFSCLCKEISVFNLSMNN